MAKNHLFNCSEQPEAQNWECTVCVETYTSTSLPWKAEDESLICANCIKGRFQDALQSSLEWPARWGTDVLDVEHYRSASDDELYNAYKAKEAAVALEESREPEVPDGCTLGVQVQSCPGCKMIIALRDGCNHIVCTKCHTNFCFICGEVARDDNGSRHWTQGGCPRYGARDSDHAMFDANDDEEEDDTPEWLITEGNDPVMFSNSIMNWNVAMQVSSPATQDILRRFLDHRRPQITAQHTTR